MSNIEYPLNLTETLRRNRFYLRTQRNNITPPTPVDPTPVDPTPVDPTPVDPTPVDPTPDIDAPYVQQLVFDQYLDSGQDSVAYMNITVKKYGSDNETTLVFNSSGPYGTTADFEVDGKIVRIRATGGSGNIAWINAFIDDSKDMPFEFKINLTSSAEFYIEGQGDSYSTVPSNPTFSMSSAGVTFILKAKATRQVVLNPSMASEVHYVPIYQPAVIDDGIVVVKQLISIACPYLTLQLDDTGEILQLENIESILTSTRWGSQTKNKYALDHTDGYSYIVEQTIYYSHARFVLYIVQGLNQPVTGRTAKITLPYPPAAITYDKILDTYWQSESTADNTELNVGFDYIAFYLESTDAFVQDAPFAIYKDPNITDPSPSTALVRHYLPTYRQGIQNEWVVDESMEYGGYWGETIVYWTNSTVYGNITIKLVNRNVQFNINELLLDVYEGTIINKTVENGDFRCVLELSGSNSHLRFKVSVFDKNTNSALNNELVQILIYGPDLDGFGKAYWIPDTLPYQLESNMSNTSFRNGLEFIMFYLLSTDKDVGDTTFKTGNLAAAAFAGGGSAMVTGIELIDIYTS